MAVSFGGGQPTYKMLENHLLVHRSEGKNAFYLGSPELFWSEELRCWVTCTPELIESIQKNPAFRVVDQAGEIDRIKARLNLDLSHIARVFDHVPVNVEGKEHRERRRRVAKTLSARTEEALERFERLARRLCAEHLGRAGTSDLVADLFEPLILELAHALSGVTLSPRPDFLSPTQIFDKSLGLSRRKLINEQIGALRARACEAMPDEDADTAVSLAILGSDTILGSLALSFAERISAHPGSALRDIDWGDRLTATAVPFIERQALEAVRYGDAEIKPNEIVRLYLDRLSMEETDKRDGFFGTGRHTCPGRAVAQQAWRLLCSALATLPYRIRIDSLKLREADCMFLFPCEIKVTVHEG